VHAEPLGEQSLGAVRQIVIQRKNPQDRETALPHLPLPFGIVTSSAARSAGRFDCADLIGVDHFFITESCSLMALFSRQMLRVFPPSASLLTLAAVAVRRLLTSVSRTEG